MLPSDLQLFNTPHTSRFKLHIKKDYDEHFEIIEILYPENPTFDLIDFLNEEIYGLAYDDELEKLNIGEEYIIDFTETYIQEMTDMGVGYDTLVEYHKIERV
jgi:hypothetical protein